MSAAQFDARRPQRPATGAGEVPRFFVHPAYLRRLLPGHVDLLGFLSYLLAESTVGQAEGRRVVTVDTGRPELAEALGKSPATVKRWEKSLERMGILRSLDHGHRSRVLEILPPPVVPMRAQGPSMVVTHDHLKPVTNQNGAPEGVVENPGKTSAGSEFQRVTSDHQNPSMVVTSDHQTGFSPL